MRTTALFRWGMTCLLLAPLALLSWLLTSAIGSVEGTPEPLATIVTASGILAPITAVLLIVAGGLLNTLAIRRGVRGVERLASGQWDAPSLPQGPRLIFPAGWEQSHPASEATHRSPRRMLGLALGAALLAWALVIAWLLTVRQPLDASGGSLDLAETYSAWRPVSQTGFVVAVVVWAALALLAVLALVLLGRLSRPGLDRLLTPVRFAALAAILASALVVAAMPAHLTLGLNLIDDVQSALGPRATNPSRAGSWLLLQGGVFFSALAILIAVPPWRRAPRSSSHGDLVARD
jgi:hypothetical protein